MKWLKVIAGFLAVALVALVAYAASTVRRPEHPVGFQVVQVQAPDGPIAVALWYPTVDRPWPTTFVGGFLLAVARDGAVAGSHLPVVLVSHGNGGSAVSHVDLAMALASAGYVVAAPTHAGDNFADPSRQGSPALFSQRAGELRATLDYLLSDWSGGSRIDADRVAAYGMSAGAFTVLTLVGGVPRMDRIATHCRATPEFICKALAHARSPLLASAEGAGTFARDPRIKAAIIVAPGLGFTFAEGGLSSVQVPVQVWSGDRDGSVPFATNTRIVQQGLGGHAEPHVVEGATHLSFLAPCGLLKPSAFCTDPGGFDREAAHAAMNAHVLRFLAAHVCAGSPAVADTP